MTFLYGIRKEASRASSIGMGLAILSPTEQNLRKEDGLLEGIRKQAILDIVVPGAYGYYTAGKGGSKAKAAIRGAIIGGGIDLIQSIGDVTKGKVTEKTLLAPIGGALKGAAAATGMHIARPFVKDKKIVSKATEKTKEVLKDIFKKIEKINLK